MMLSEVNAMNVSYNDFKKNIDAYADNAVAYDEHTRIGRDKGNVVLLSEKEYDRMIETLYLLSIPGMEDDLIRARNASSDDLIPFEEIEW